MYNEIRTIVPIYESFIMKFKKDHEIHLLKYRRMQDLYLEKNLKYYTKNQIQKIKQRFDALVHKSLLTSLHLEQLWAMSDYLRNNLLYSLDNLPKKVMWNNTQLIIGNMFLQSYLFQARSMLDFYMGYICVLFGEKRIDSMSIRNFKKKMKNIKGCFNKKASDILEYFNNYVFKSGKWGNSLNKLRNIVTHGNDIQIQYDSKEILLNKIILNWPTINGLTYEQLCQEIDNGIFQMLVDTSEILFELEWKPGPYKRNLWKV